MAATVYQATVSAPVNIACIKCGFLLAVALVEDADLTLHRYWGKRDTKLILPTNSSLSVALDQDHLRSTTTSRADPPFEKDRLWLNGTEGGGDQGGRAPHDLHSRDEARERAQGEHLPSVLSSLARRSCPR